MKLFFRERFLKAMNKSIIEKTSRLCATKYIFSIASCFFFYDKLRIFFSPAQAKNHWFVLLNNNYLMLFYSVDAKSSYE